MPVITSQRGTQLTWDDVARYYGVTVDQLFRGSSAYVAGARSPRPNQRVGGGVTLNVPSVVNSVSLPGGGFTNRGHQNVFRNESYIERRQEAREQRQQNNSLSHDVTEEEYWASTQIDWAYIQNLVTNGGTPPDWWQNVVDSGRPLPSWVPATGGWGGTPASAGGAGGGEDPLPDDSGEGSNVDSEPDPLGGRDPGDITAGIIGRFPWMEPWYDLILGIVTGGETSADVVLAAIRQDGAYLEMFPNIFRPDGTMRFNESQYMSTVDAYRGLLGQYGLGDQYSNADISNFFSRDVDINELNERLDIYDQILRGGADLRAAFYVYGGISMSDEDLYNYVVDPIERGNIDAQYFTASSELDYATYLARAADIVMANTGAYVDRDTTVAVLDQLEHGGDPVNGSYLSLAELTAAYEAAMIGSAATSVGLQMADLSQVERFRQAGITHASALQQYGIFARDQNFLDAVVQRARGGEFTQSDFENAQFLQDPTQQRELARGLAQETARGETAGAFNFTENQGRLAQGGFSAFRS